MINNDDGTYVVDYVPGTTGVHTITASYGGISVPQSPIKVPVKPHVDVSKVKVDGLEPSKVLILIMVYGIKMGILTFDRAICFQNQSWCSRKLPLGLLKKIQIILIYLFDYKFKS